MRTVAGTDDYASLAETVSRRAGGVRDPPGRRRDRRLCRKARPAADGRRPRPGERAREALAGTALADVPLYGMVKDSHHRTRAIVDGDGQEIAIQMNRGTFTFITAIQEL